MDKNYFEYNELIKLLLDEAVIMQVSSTLKALGKFKRNSAGIWETFYYPGFTLITPTSNDDSENKDTYLKIIGFQDSILKKLNSGKIIPAPVKALHLTVARLVSDDMYLNKIAGTNEAAFLSDFGKFFNRLPKIDFIKMKVTGISLFQNGVIAAMVSEIDESEYKKLLAFRNYIYSNEKLKEYGVEQKRSFIGHISLGYIEERLSENERIDMEEAIFEVNDILVMENLEFNLTRVELRKFSDFLSFNRKNDWPVYNFSV